MDVKILNHCTLTEKNLIKIQKNSSILTVHKGYINEVEG